MTQQPWGFKLTMTEAMEEPLNSWCPNCSPFAIRAAATLQDPPFGLGIPHGNPKVGKFMIYLKAPTIIFILCLKPSISDHQSGFLGKNLRPRGKGRKLAWQGALHENTMMLRMGVLPNLLPGATCGRCPCCRICYQGRHAGGVHAGGWATAKLLVNQPAGGE